MRCRRPPFQCCGRRCVCCGRLSRFVLSLASAGNVCWAKPNHGFFNCQHPVAIIFRDTRMALVNDALAQPRRRPHLTHAQPRASPCANATRKQWRGLQRSCACIDACAREVRGILRASPRCRSFAFLADESIAREAMPLRVAQARLRKTARTFSRIESDRRAAIALFPAPENEGPAAFPPRVPAWCSVGRARQWSSSSSSSA